MVTHAEHGQARLLQMKHMYLVSSTPSVTVISAMIALSTLSTQPLELVSSAPARLSS